MMRARLYNISIKCMLAILSAGLIVSCKDDDEDYGYSSVVGNIIDFFPLQEGFQKPVTRVAGVIDPESYNLDKIDKIGVLSMKKGSTEGWTTVFQNDNTSLEVLPLFNNGFTNNGQIWNYYTNPAEWEEGYQYKFRAYFPLEFNTSAGETCASGFVHSDFIGGSTKLTLTDYKSASNPKDNTDLLVSDLRVRNYPDDGDTAVSLKMNHLLACVNFNFRGPEGKEVHVTDFSIAGYKDKGNYDSDADSKKWTFSSGSSEYTATILGNQMELKVLYSKDGYYDGSKGMQVAGPVVLEMPDGLVFKVKESKDYWEDGKKLEAGDVISPERIFLSGGSKPSYIDKSGDWQGKTYQNFYIEYNKSWSASMTENNSNSMSFEGLLFIPQEVERLEEKLEVLTVIITPVYGVSQDGSYNKGGGTPYDVGKVSVKTGMYAQVSYYFDNEINDVKTAIIADLTGNGKITEWEAGKKYNYTVGLYEYQATANIFVEDWTHHTYEEELK